MRSNNCNYELVRSFNAKSIASAIRAFCSNRQYYFVPSVLSRLSISLASCFDVVQLRFTHSKSTVKRSDGSTRATQTLFTGAYSPIIFVCTNLHTAFKFIFFFLYKRKPFDRIQKKKQKKKDEFACSSILQVYLAVYFYVQKCILNTAFEKFNED